MKLTRSAMEVSKSIDIDMDSLAQVGKANDQLGTDDADLGIYDDHGSGPDLTDTEDEQEVSKHHSRTDGERGVPSIREHANQPSHVLTHNTETKLHELNVCPVPPEKAFVTAHSEYDDDGRKPLINDDDGLELGMEAVQVGLVEHAQGDRHSVHFDSAADCSTIPLGGAAAHHATGECNSSDITTGDIPGTRGRTTTPTSAYTEMSKELSIVQSRYVKIEYS